MSRFHASIKYAEGHFYLLDEASKFGTLVQLRKPVSIPPLKNTSLTLQIGRYLVELSSADTQLDGARSCCRRRFTAVNQSVALFEQVSDRFPREMQMKLLGRKHCVR